MVSTVSGRFRHLLPFVTFVLLAAALSWPLAPSFTTQLIADGGPDPLLALWGHWHLKEAFAGHQPLLATDLLYFPRGIALLNHAPGPLSSLLALPFWLFGPEAAYNGTYLLGLTFTGFCAYLLGISLGMGRGPALLVGIVYASAPMTLAGLYGHIDKSTLFLFPLLLLSLGHSLDPRRRRVWLPVTAALLTLTLLHHGYHFVAAVLALVVLTATRLLLTSSDERGRVGRRTMALALTIVVVTGPLVAATLLEASDPAGWVNRNLESFRHRPDLMELVLPPAHSRLWGGGTASTLRNFGVFQTIETTVTLNLGALALALLGLRRTRRCVSWFLLLSVCVVLALGPSLQAFGRDTFTEYELPLTLPYALLTGLPGMSGMRVSGRFMLVGNLALAVAAGYGLAWLGRGRSGRGRILLGLSVAAVLLENWPAPWPRRPIPEPPSFYEALAGEEDRYGVFDLPTLHRPYDAYVSSVATYQAYQMTHGKGIHGGYLSFSPRVHPLFPCFVPEVVPRAPDVRVGGRPVECHRNALFDLATLGYRYIVWHKRLQPSALSDATRTLLLDQLEDPRPVVNDGEVMVWNVPSEEEARERASPVMGLLHGWYSREAGERRWARSPAALYLSIPRRQTVVLQIVPDLVYVPGSEEGLGNRGTLEVSVGEVTFQKPLKSGETIEFFLPLSPGIHSVTLALKAGNFTPATYGSDDTRRLSFAIRSLNLETMPGRSTPASAAIRSSNPRTLLRSTHLVLAVAPSRRPEYLEPARTGKVLPRRRWRAGAPLFRHEG